VTQAEARAAFHWGIPTRPNATSAVSRAKPPRTAKDADGERSRLSPGGPGRRQCVACSFDEIDRDALVAQAERRVVDRKMLKLLRSWLRAGVFEGGVVSDPGAGTPAGLTLAMIAGFVVWIYAVVVCGAHWVVAAAALGSSSTTRTRWWSWSEYMTSMLMPASAMRRAIAPSWPGWS
jgi:hypothetical protein